MWAHVGTTDGCLWQWLCTQQYCGGYQHPAWWDVIAKLLVVVPFCGCCTAVFNLHCCYVPEPMQVQVISYSSLCEQVRQQVRQLETVRTGVVAGWLLGCMSMQTEIHGGRTGFHPEVQMPLPMRRPVLVCAEARHRLIQSITPGYHQVLAAGGA